MKSSVDAATSATCMVESDGDPARRKTLLKFSTVFRTCNVGREIDIAWRAGNNLSSTSM